MFATRFSASEAFLVKITSSREGALRNPATLSRAASNASVDSAPSWCIARAMLALCRSRWSTIVSITTCGFCEVFADVEVDQRQAVGQPRPRIGKSARMIHGSSPGSQPDQVRPLR